MNKLTLLVLLFGVSSFNFSFGQTTTLKFESFESIVEYANNHKLDFNQEDLFVLGSLDDILDFSSSGLLKGPVVHVFSSEGLYLERIIPDNAKKKLTDFSRIRKKSKKNTYSMEKWFSQFVNCKDGTPISRKDNVDYYFVITWAFAFQGELRVSTAFKWYDLLQRKKVEGENIQIILLNLDLQELWNLSPEVKADLLKQNAQ